MQGTPANAFSNTFLKIPKIVWIKNKKKNNAFVMSHSSEKFDLKIESPKAPKNYISKN